MILYILLALFGLFLTFLGVMGVLGSRLPDTHTASVVIEVGSSQQAAWEAIDNVAAYPTWIPDITKVEMLPDKDGKRVFRETHGRNAFTFEETVKNPPHRVMRTITDVNGPFSGSWDHTLEALGDSRTRITIAEVGTIKGAIPKAFMRYLFGEDYYLKRMGVLLQKKLGA